MRTSGLCLPKAVLYQAELLPDRDRMADHPVQERGAHNGGEPAGVAGLAPQGFRLDPRFAR